ncbi:MAG: hypothetical protein JNK79_05835 [Chitinophagaceae bacterium]|nr:hypothetical protein [Chitinophagaceae bacterium]
MATFTQTFRIYETLNKYFNNEEDAKAMASGIEEMVNYRFQSEKERLATKMDIMELKGDISHVKMRIRQAFHTQMKLIILIMTGFSLLIVSLITLLLRGF